VSWFLFAVGVVGSVLTSLMIWAILGPVPAALWSGACFGFGAMFAIGKQELDKDG